MTLEMPVVFIKVHPRESPAHVTLFIVVVSCPISKYDT